MDDTAVAGALVRSDPCLLFQHQEPKIGAAAEEFGGHGEPDDSRADDQQVGSLPEGYNGRLTSADAKAAKGRVTLDSSTSGKIVGLIKQRLTSELSPAHLEIVDESHLHSGHEGAGSGGGHYTVSIVSAAFEQMGLAHRHRLVYKALAGMVNREIHALALRTMTPSEWQNSPPPRGVSSS